MKKRKRKRHTILTIFNLDINIKCQFKAWCSERGKSMLEVVEEMMLEKIKK